jgi:hypothetical protein
LKKLLLFLLFIQTNVHAQNCSSMNIQWQSDVASVCSLMTMTMLHDQLSRDYLYVANKEAGLKVYNVSSLSSPAFITSVPISFYDSLEVMNLSQQDNFLYLALGNHFNNSQPAGMAIVDVSNPVSPFVTDFIKLDTLFGGSGIVKADGNYAYLGAMTHGLVILDISDKYNIQFVSQFKPSIYYPDPNPTPSFYNARGLEVKNDIVYLCYDAGGLRIINIQDRYNPVETGRYSNPVMNGLPRAYNNIVLDDTLAFIAVDYCGMEVLNVSDTANITLHGWWNPYDCPGNTWGNSPVHSNEIQFNKDCHLIFLSTGKSDLHILDVSNPAIPDSCNYYGGVSNGIGTWGVSVYDNGIYLSYVCALIPFTSFWTGVKILTYEPCNTGIDDYAAGFNTIELSPNPAHDYFSISLKEDWKLPGIAVRIYNILGVLVKEQNIPSENTVITRDGLSDGIYFAVVRNGEKEWRGKVVVE